jgi:Flp pilus assembly protein protease CpaA
MSTCHVSRSQLQPYLVPRLHAWGWAAIAPLVLAFPWLQLCRLGEALLPEPTPKGSSLAHWVERGPAWVGTMHGLLLVLLLSSATVTDLLWRRIYNWTTYTALGWVVLLQLLIPWFKEVEGAMTGPCGSHSLLGMLPWRDSLAGFAVGFAIMFVLYNVFRGGAGDLKLVAVLGALVGVPLIIEMLIYSYILAGLFAACLLVGTAGPGAILAFALGPVGFAGFGRPASMVVKDCMNRRLPMAPFIASGTLLALVLS